MDTRHEAFCRLMAKGKMSQAQAYLDAGYQCSSPDSAYAAASRLLGNVKVQARIAYLQEQAAHAAVLDASYVLDGLKRNAEAAFDKGDFSASNRALEILGKHLGMFSEKLDVEVTPGIPKLNDDERRKLLKAILEPRELEAV